MHLPQTGVEPLHRTSLSNLRPNERQEKRTGKEKERKMETEEEERKRGVGCGFLVKEGREGMEREIEGKREVGNGGEAACPLSCG